MSLFPYFFPLPLLFPSHFLSNRTTGTPFFIFLPATAPNGSTPFRPNRTRGTPFHSLTTVVRKLSKYSQVFTPVTRWSPHEPHCTNACPGCLVCVVGALGRFLSCKGVNGSSVNGGFRAPLETENKLGTFTLCVLHLSGAHTMLAQTHLTTHGHPQASHQAHSYQ